MTTPIAILEEAAAEARDAVEQLEAARPGLGDVFADVLRGVVAIAHEHRRPGYWVGRQ